MHDQPQPPNLFADFDFADEIESDPLEWLWPHRVPLAKLTLIIGDPGIGKSLLAIDIAAHVSTGAPWPDAPSCLRASVPSCLPLPAIIHAPEDIPANTLVPRLKAAGADLERICILKGVLPYLRSADPSKAILRPPSLRRNDTLPLRLPTHTHVLQQAVRAVSHPRLLILDPLHTMIEPGRLDRTLADLAETARDYNIAIIAVCHLTKEHTRRILYRVRGSLSIIAAARAAHILTEDPDRPDRRILTPIKSIDGPPPEPLTFTITDGPRLAWESTSASPLTSCLRASVPSCLSPDLSPDAHYAIIEACDWLADALAEGPRPAAELLREARSLGHSTKTLRRAKRMLAIYSLKPANEDGWIWTTERTDNQHGQLGGAQK